MAYTINRTDGAIFATVTDGTINSDSSITIIGKNYAGYGAFLGENFIRLLENGANSVVPVSPLTGELWFDTVAGLLKVFNGSEFKNLSTTTAAGAAPGSSITGDLWFDTSNSQLNVYDGSEYILVGPAFTGAEGTSGAIVDTITDTLATDHVVVKSYVEGVVVAVTSKDATFTIDVGSQFDGFTGTISPGVQLASIILGNTPQFLGKATDTDLFDGELISTFLRSNANDTTTGTLGVLNDGGITVGVDSDLVIDVATVHVGIENKNTDANIVLRVNPSGVPTDVITVNGTTSRAEVSDPLINSDIANKGWSVTTIDNSVAAGVLNMLKKDGTVDITGVIKPNTDGTLDFGAVANKFATMYATTFNGESTSAQYADLAERFESDTHLMPGTVVELGGVKEITKAATELSSDILGVISTSAGFLMNAGAGSEETHPPVAMSGRVPVRVIGKVKKGARLVSAGNGLAREATLEEATSFNVIGRSLENKFTTEEGMIEAIVTVN